MAGKIKANTSALMNISKSLKKIKQNVDEVVDIIPNIRRMSQSAWDGNNEVSQIFENNCNVLRKNCIKVEVDIEKHATQLDKVIQDFNTAENKSISIVSALSADNIF